MSTTVCVNGTVQFTSFLVMRLNITIVMSCDSLIVIINLIFSSLKLENGLKKYVWNVTRMKYEFVELVVILFTFIQDVIKLFLLILPEKNSHCAWWKLSLLISDVLICFNYCIDVLIIAFKKKKKTLFCIKDNFQYTTRIILTKMFKLSSSVQFLYK